MTFIRKSVLTVTLGAAAMTAASPAMADDWRWHRHGGGDTTGAAIAGGVIGLALGAAIASSANDHRRYDRDYYEYDRYPRYRTYYYYDNYPRPYYRPYYYRGDGWGGGWRGDSWRNREWREHEWRERHGGWGGGWRGRGW